MQQAMQPAMAPKMRDLVRVLKPRHQQSQMKGGRKIISPALSRENGKFLPKTGILGQSRQMATLSHEFRKFATAAVAQKVKENPEHPVGQGQGPLGEHTEYNGHPLYVFKSGYKTKLPAAAELNMQQQDHAVSAEQFNTMITKQELSPVELPELPRLTNFRDGKDFFTNGVREGNAELREVYLGSPETLKAFRSIFPEVVASRRVTKLPKDTFAHWDRKSNVVTVEPEPADLVPHRHEDVLCVGGPCSLVAALCHKLRHPTENVTHVVTDRYDSNHDGSAYYYHERDAVPVYVHKVNTGLYCVFIDLKKRLFAMFGGGRLVRECEQNAHHVKIQLNWYEVMMGPSRVFTIFIPNVYHWIMDCFIRKPETSLMAQAVKHSQQTPKIVEGLKVHYGVPTEALLHHGKDKAIYVGLRGAQEDPAKFFEWLNQYAHLPFHSLPTHLYGPQVEKILSFPRDGCFSPWILENLELAMQKAGCNLRKGMALQKIFVEPCPVDSSQVRVSKVLLVNIHSRREEVVSVGKLFFSNGPSCQVKLQHNYTLRRHIVDTIAGRKEHNTTMFQPTLQSVGRHAVNNLKKAFRGNLLFKETMWAAGSSSVMLIGLRKSTVPEEKIQIFRNYMDGVNQHWTPIAERDVRITGSPDVYRFFAIQMTGGGNFPSRHTRPDVLLSLMNTTEKIFGLKDCDPGDVMYDLVQARGCGRSVSSRNTISFAPLGNNCVAAYGLGGIGMSTMFPNGELMIQLSEFAKKPNSRGLSNGKIGDQDALLRLYGENLNGGTDYRAIVDDVDNAARYFGRNNSSSNKEYFWGAFALVFAGVGATSIKFLHKHQEALKARSATAQSPATVLQ
eukprot:gnl/MRDRNA2_/MRDRNA2_86705_c0_seq1.p1 gnl/MRDRNA2_/MRDRNA2_86705_c0~~gnl/MRDRNA2_/MRDRNA2_86705_c0_seq1.p1  ORF type:complete len:843 (+),score=122.37 gnl/MRDRNA2_/MRDRNA2_86705_c0_seq1:187-2715(+)